MRIIWALTLILLAGCATHHHAGVEAVNKGDLAGAERHFSQALAGGDMYAWNNLGVVYERMGLPEKANQHYIMGARWGDPTAQRNLTARGLPVPPADLAMQRAQTNAADSAAMANFLNAISPPRPAPLVVPQQTNCTSRRVGNTVQTQCW